MPTCFKSCCDVLQLTPVQLEDTPEHRLRMAVMETLVKIPITEAGANSLHLCLFSIPHMGNSSHGFQIKNSEHNALVDPGYGC